MTYRRRTASWGTLRVRCRAMVLVASVGAVGCGWKVPDTVGPGTTRGTIVVMQNQDGEILGSKFFEPASMLTVSTADAGSAAPLLSKYIVVRSEPTNGRIGSSLVATTDSGIVSFPSPGNGVPLRAVFMSTADAREDVMDCVYHSYWGVGFKEVGRALPGLAIPLSSVAVVDGDETIFTDAIEDLNRALTDRRGILLGRLSWDRENGQAEVLFGFSSPPAVLSDFLDWFSSRWYILVDPRDPRGTQTIDAVSGLLCPDGCGQLCGKSLATYLLDPGANFRLSRQGVSLLRFSAYWATE